MNNIEISRKDDSFPLMVDIITISKNTESVILKTLISVSEQTYGDINHIIIDGKSTDNTINNISSFSHEKRIIIYQQEPLGIANAFNTGLSKSYGELVIFLNSGDRFASKTVIQQIVDSYIQNKWLWATGETISVSRRGYLKRYVRQHSKWKQELFLYRNPICHQSTIFSRKLLSQVGLYNEKLSLGMDYDFNIRCSLVSHPLILYFPVSYFDTTGTSSMQVLKSYRTYKEIRNKYFTIGANSRFILDSLYFIKSIIRIFMIPMKLFF